MSRTLAANGLTERAYLRDLSGELASNRLFNAADDIVFDGESDSAIAEVPETLAQAQFSAAWSRYDVFILCHRPVSSRFADANR